METFNTLDPSPFKNMVMTVGNLPSSFVASMSYYEALAWLCNYLQTEVIPTVNNNSEVSRELQEKFVELKDYVEHYFENLDVQEEINNKLDELVESGTLQRILNSPATTENIGGVIVGDGIDVDENGKIDIKASEGITVDENGVSVSNCYINDIEVNTYQYVDDVNNVNSTIHYSIISSEFKPKFVLADENDVDAKEKASDFDYNYKPTLMLNLSPYDVSNHTYSPIIIDGIVKSDDNHIADATYWYAPTLGIDNNGNFHCYNGSTPASELDVNYACPTWACLYNDGDTNPNLDPNATRDPRTILAQDYNGNYLAFVCGGRAFNDTGMNSVDVLNFIQNELNFNAKLIFSLDGGGSSQMLYHGIRQNVLVDDEDRACPSWVVWSVDNNVNKDQYKNQSINNKSKLNDIDFADGHMIDSQTINDKMCADTDKIFVHDSARIFLPNSRLVVYNLSFKVRDNQSFNAYSLIFDNLPRTNASIYSSLVKRSDNSRIACYLKPESDRSKLVNIGSLSSGDYDFNIAVYCDRQY